MASQAAAKVRQAAFITIGCSFRCDQCDFASRNEIVLTEHKKLFHQPCGPPPVRFECQHCRASFRRQDRLLCHLQKHTGNGSFDCYLCPGTFASEQNLVRHVKTTHGSAESFHCYLCQSKFSRKDNLLVHVRKHLSDTSRC
ncbi:zinc finger Y-chromosomal protein-like [Amblyomma americanum]